jgi:hypothetical protein
VKLKIIALAFATAITVPALASNPLINEQFTGDSRIYKCRSTPEGWYCARVLDTTGNSDPDNVDWLEIAAATRAARAERVGGAPVDACVNSHGGSACCRRIGSMPDGTVYIECG